MAAVPRKAEAFVGGLERARLGASAADAKAKNARRGALDQVVRGAIADAVATGLDGLIELAASNPDLDARVLLELAGQGARGVMRTRAWYLRNGCAIRRGEHGAAVSMFGAYLFAVRQSTGRFGDVGEKIGPCPKVEADYWLEACGGDELAAGILIRRRGYDLPAVSAGLDRLQAALVTARKVSDAAGACLSCSSGCVLCSCADDKPSRQAVLDLAAMGFEPIPEAKPAKIGRPAAVRAEIPAVSDAMRRVRELRAESDRLRHEAAELEREAMREAWASHSLGDIAATAGVTRARVHQIVSD